ncbi:alpha-1,2-mannosyltransferase [Filobasidium floriforme]|uniref:alpha-1,2-mannosyltransferase n=1 Tax=Filobasidium floriforme TaxID=5210 RepID=UPI001E8DF7D6|nr:alpha-1,2-mannosyltransferase [Filobasidium floriforme]KAH8081227.1 alpha-1,2-mannosyltransferase [Filobasidium floriforme]
MMVPKWRYLAAAAGMLFGLHLLLSVTSTTYSHHTSITKILPNGVKSSNPTDDSSLYHPNAGVPGWASEHTPWLEGSMVVPPSSIPKNHTDPNRRKAKAVFVVLARNSDLWALTDSMKQMEDRFNHWAGYDWVFLNDEPFDDVFKKFTQSLTNSKCSYGLIEPHEWHQPDWIDEERATAAREEMIRKKVIYGHSVPYRNMCRYNSGFFFRHPLLADYDYYWRVEPSVKFFCDIAYDPFLVMQDQGKVYGFTISLFEYIETIPSLWDSVKDFIKKYPEYIPEGNGMKFLSDDGGETYNRCHFWSNFEIGDLNFWRSEAYMKFFEHLDEAGGFYYERWGDAPVHSIGAALFAKKEQIHFFEDIGYRHEPFQHCPQGEAHSRGKCWCDVSNNFDWEWYSCTNKYVDMFKDE